MSTQAKKRRLRRRLIAAGVLATAITALSVPVADAHPTGVYQMNAPAAANHARPFHTNPRDRASFYRVQPSGSVTSIVQGGNGSGFAWGDAAIGAAFAAVAAGLIGGVRATRAHRSIVSRDPSTGGAA